MFDNAFDEGVAFPEDDNPADLIPPRLRRFLYISIAPVGALLQFYGIASENEYALWAGLVTAILTGGTAAVYRPKGD